MFGKKKKTKNESIGDKVIKGIAENISPENAVITYILLQSRDNNISLARKDDITYISFRNEKIKTFLSEWYNILQLYKNKKMSQNIYKIFVDSQLKENKINSENEFDDDF